jgi:hypothetical protein
MAKTKPPAEQVASATTEDILTRILREAWEFKQASRPFLAVFDLDSTLFDLSLRVASIVDSFAADPVHRASFPNECESLKRIEIRNRDWGIEEPLKRAGLAIDGAFFKSLHRYWAECFFSNDFLLHDEPIAGSVEFVQELHLTGAEIMYLTGRDVARMGRGTESSLRSHRFPMDAANVHVVLKPSVHLDDAQFKLEILQDAKEKYERIWLFENEPVNLNLIAMNCPEIGLVFIDSTHSGREELQPVLDTIQHWKRVPATRVGG